MNSFYRQLASIIFCISLPGTLSAQIPNAGFEDWTGGEPDSWNTSNLQGQVTNVTQTSDAFSGASAVRGEVVDFFGFPYGPGIMTGFTGPCCLPFPITENYETFSGYYKCHTEGLDIGLGVFVSFLDEDMQVTAFGGGEFGDTDIYESFSVVMDYNQGTGNDAAFAQIQFTVSTDDPDSLSRGTWIIVDELSFGGTVDVEEIESNLPSHFDLRQNYPNPFNPSTTFEFSLSTTEDVRLSVFNLIGQEVAQVLDERLAAGTYAADWDAGDLPSGVYVYRLTAGGFVESRKLILLR